MEKDWEKVAADPTVGFLRQDSVDLLIWTIPSGTETQWGEAYMCSPKGVTLLTGAGLTGLPGSAAWFWEKLWLIFRLDYICVRLKSNHHSAK